MTEPLPLKDTQSRARGPCSRCLCGEAQLESWNVDAMHACRVPCPWRLGSCTSSGIVFFFLLSNAWYHSHLTALLPGGSQFSKGFLPQWEGSLSPRYGLSVPLVPCSDQLAARSSWPAWATVTCPKSALLPAPTWQSSEAAIVVLVPCGSVYL